MDLEAFGPAAAGLFCVALLLSAARARTRTLWTPVGIHAGAVLVIFSYGALTDRLATPAWAGTRLLYDGPVAWALMLVAAALLARGRVSPAPEETPPGTGP